VLTEKPSDNMVFHPRGLTTSLSIDLEYFCNRSGPWHYRDTFISHAKVSGGWKLV